MGFQPTNNIQEPVFDGYSGMQRGYETNSKRYAGSCRVFFHCGTKGEPQVKHHMNWRHKNTWSPSFMLSTEET
jgi:hypothetical protein